jgi:hypothetical protein
MIAKLDRKFNLSSDDGDRLVGPAHLDALRGHTTQVTPRAATPAPHHRTRLTPRFPSRPASHCNSHHDPHIFLHTFASKH